jgi:hypothetical protein
MVLKLFLTVALLSLSFSLPVYGFELKSDQLEPGQIIDGKQTCDGSDLSPELHWTNIPNQAKSLALITDDPDAPVGVWVHWVLYDLPAATVRLEEGVPRRELLESGAKQGVNDFGRTGYNGPCPPSGKAHRYFFKLYALDNFLNLPPRARKDDVVRAMEGHILDQTELMGKYSRREKK